MFSATGNVGVQTRRTNANWRLRLRTTTWQVCGNGGSYPRSINFGIKWTYK